MDELPRDVIEGRLQLLDALEGLVDAGEYLAVLDAVELVRRDLRTLAGFARRMAVANGDEVPEPRTRQRDPRKEELLQQALAQIQAVMGMTAERKARRDTDDEVLYLADQLDRRRERLNRRPPGFQ